MVHRSIFGLGLLALLVVSSVPQPAFGQSQLLPKGTSGFALGTGLGTAEDVAVLSGFLGFSAVGILDLGVRLNRYALDSNGADLDLNATGIEPFINLFLVKQSTDSPVSLYVTGAYEADTYSGDAIDKLEWEMSASTYSFGAGVSAAMQVDPTIEVIPEFTVGHYIGEVEITDGFGRSISEDSDVTVFSFGATLAFMMPSRAKLALDLGLSVNDQNDSALGVGLGFTLPVSTD